MALALVGREASVESVTYRDLYLRELGIDPMTASDETLRDALGDVVIDPQSLVSDDWLDLLMTHRIQPGLSPDAILVVRSDERRVGKEGGSTCRSRWWPSHYNKK